MKTLRTPRWSPIRSHSYHCCPTTDGASALLVASEDVAREVSETPVQVTGSGTASGAVGLFQRDTRTGIPATGTAAKRAYEQVGVGPEDVEFAEVHHCFVIAELLAYEDLGFCGRGEAPWLLRKAITDPDGDLLVNTSGGLKSKGYPIGATGARQTVEVFEQLRGDAHI